MGVSTEKFEAIYKPPHPITKGETEAKTSHINMVHTINNWRGSIQESETRAYTLSHKATQLQYGAEGACRNQMTEGLVFSTFS